MTTRWAGAVASSLVLDVIVVGVNLALGITAVTVSEPFEPSVATLGILALSSVTIPARRRYPRAVLAIAAVAFLLTTAPVALMLAAGSLTETSGARPRTWAAIAVASVPVFWGAHESDDLRRPVLVWAVLVCLPAAVGLYLNSRQLAVEAATARADELAAAQHVLAEAARREERSRIAREMHDVVAHQVSLIALHAGALELTAAGTPAEESARTIRLTASQALEELRDVVGMLRSQEEDDAERSPQASLEHLAQLVEEWRQAGVDAVLEDRSPPAFLETVPARVGRTAYRVVREALTNASKHAPGARVEVVLGEAGPGEAGPGEGEARLSVVVHNSAPTRVSSRAASGSGVGHFGLRERVQLLGGTFEAGPDGRGGYRVSVLLPVGEDEV